MIAEYFCEKVSHIKSQIICLHDLFKLLHLEITTVNKIFLKIKRIFKINYLHFQKLCQPW